MCQEKIHYGGWPDCIRLYNKEVEMMVTTNVGPRIIHFGFTGDQNVLYVSPEDSGKTGGNDWRIYGGHRLWIAPEAIPLSYHPDNSPVDYVFHNGSLTVTAAKEGTSGIRKEIQITLSAVSNEVTVTHRLTNENSLDMQLSVWAISALAPGGCAIVPQEPYGEGNDFLLPARPLALWQYTKMNDPRWVWGEKYILAKQDTTITGEQKIGVLNKQGWAAYHLGQNLLVKKFDYNARALYPDYGCNNEVYINGAFLEIETLGPLITLAPGETTAHIERWSLYKTEDMSTSTEQLIDSTILPLVIT
ncbi:MAG: hypothetical protein KF746_16645 [Chitinophagaceae bacterium]|nr:hypothetical protein [Chitinophagaceae bacterium]